MRASEVQCMDTTVCDIDSRLVERLKKSAKYATDHSGSAMFSLAGLDCFFFSCVNLG